MYATCIFCHSALGSNEAIEHFPVGKRLAFDAAKGRLWVVCGKCERWNLSPLDERWEAIEEAERAYRDTKKRVATDNIGLARVADGTDLIRIGEPLRPEFAAWRYGEVFASRTKKAVVSTLTVSAFSAVVGSIGTHSLGLAVGAGIALHSGVSLGVGYVQSSRRRARVIDASGLRVSLSQYQAAWTRFSFDPHNNQLRLRVSSAVNAGAPLSSRAADRVRALVRLERVNRTADLEGDAAMTALANLLPVVNQYYDNPTDVQEAVKLVENAPSPREMFHLTPHGDAGSGGRWNPKRFRLAGMPTVLRFALEMSLHEADERRALEGELHILEQRWKDAEEIAAIADGLTLPHGLEERAAALRDRTR